VAGRGYQNVNVGRKGSGISALILRTLIFGSQHGQGIARAVQETSEKELLVEHGALDPALQRLEERGWISAKRGGFQQP
jgi:PadR family transcriptional regulator, regulatory protein PadR